jgi:hypothetical protein
LMTAQEARDLQANTFTAAPDRRAVQRLYAASLDGGMRNRELQIKARRGTAAPSGREPLAVLPLEVS